MSLCFYGVIIRLDDDFFPRRFFPVGIIKNVYM